MINGHSCDTCPYFHAFEHQRDDRGTGHCRFFAPKLVVQEDRPKTVWPLTHADSGCGDHPDVVEERRQAA